MSTVHTGAIDVGRFGCSFVPSLPAVTATVAAVTQKELHDKVGGLHLYLLRVQLGPGGRVMIFSSCLPLRPFADYPRVVTVSRDGPR